MTAPPRIPSAFFFDDYTEQAGLPQDQVELLALVRTHGVTTTQLRALLTTTPEIRQAIANLIPATTQAESERLRHVPDQDEDQVPP